MSQLRFQHVFLALMATSALAAFVLPASYAGNAPQLAALFAPISRPSGSIARWFHDRISPEPVTDRRSSEAVRTENLELKSEVQSLSIQLDDLRARDAERSKFGTLRDFCTPFAVIGLDAGERESLLLRGSTFEGLHSQMAAIYTGGVAGTLDRAGVAGAQVRLITDPGFRVRGSIGIFGRRSDNTIEFKRLDITPTLFQGVGSNTMQSDNLKFEDLTKAKVAVGDAVVLTDSDWSPRMQGQPLGRIVSISPRPRAPLYALIKIQPQTKLIRLREIMVVTKEK